MRHHVCRMRAISQCIRHQDLRTDPLRQAALELHYPQAHNKRRIGLLAAHALRSNITHQRVPALSQQTTHIADNIHTNPSPRGVITFGSILRQQIPTRGINQRAVQRARRLNRQPHPTELPRLRANNPHLGRIRTTAIETLAHQMRHHAIHQRHPRVAISRQTHLNAGNRHRLRLSRDIKRAQHPCALERKDLSGSNNAPIIRGIKNRLTLRNQPPVGMQQRGRIRQRRLHIRHRRHHRGIRRLGRKTRIGRPVPLHRRAHPIAIDQPNVVGHPNFIPVIQKRRAGHGQQHRHRAFHGLRRT